MEFEFSFDCAKVLSEMRKEFKYYPIELQLIWLSEMLLIIAFGIIKDKKKVKLNKNKDKYVFTQRNAESILSTITLDSEIPILLDTFRNAYVHRGAYNAFYKFKEILDNVTLINKLAEFAGVTLNWNCSLYKILDVKDV